MDAIRYGFNGTIGDSKADRRQQRIFQTNKFNILSNSTK